MDVLQFKTAIWNLQRSIAENANALFSSVEAQNGLTPQQAALLLELAQKGPCRMGDLARTLCLTKTNATPLCKHLEEAGYLTRRRGETDERVVWVTLSPQGKKAATQLETAFEQQIQPLFQPEDTQELELVVDGMRRLDSLLKRMRSVLEHITQEGE